MPQQEAYRPAQIYPDRPNVSQCDIAPLMTPGCRRIPCTADTISPATSHEGNRCKNAISPFAQGLVFPGCIRLEALYSKALWASGDFWNADL